MKKAFNILVALCAGVLVFSCEKTATEPEKVSFDIDSVKEVSASGETFTLKLLSNVAWSLDGYDDNVREWISVSPESGNANQFTQTVTITVSENRGDERSATIVFKGESRSAQLTINQEGGSLSFDIEDGSESGPYKASTALAMITGGSSNLSTEVYVYGIISEITEVSTYYGNATYYISDDGTTNNQLCIFRGYYLYSDSFTSESQIKVGDEVIVCGKLQMYNDDTPEMSKANYIYYLNGVYGKKETVTETPSELTRDTPGKWLELPATDIDNLYFISHKYTTPALAGQRNYSYYFDPSVRYAAWVAYPLNAGLIGSGSRTDEWGLDPKVPEKNQQIIYKAYQGGYQRGHQIPSADRLYKNENVSTFYFTNMTPQLGDFNENGWATLEGYVRDWAKACDTLYVVTGADYRNSTAVATDNNGVQIPVPTAYFKALLGYKSAGFSSSSDNYMAVGFYMKHEADNGSKLFSEQAVSIDALEVKLGTDLFVNLSSVIGSDKAAAVESAAVSSWWESNK